MQTRIIAFTLNLWGAIVSSGEATASSRHMSNRTDLLQHSPPFLRQGSARNANVCRRGTCGPLTLRITPGAKIRLHKPMRACLQGDSQDRGRSSGLHDPVATGSVLR